MWSIFTSIQIFNRIHRYHLSTTPAPILSGAYFNTPAILFNTSALVAILWLAATLARTNKRQWNSTKFWIILIQMSSLLIHINNAYWNNHNVLRTCNFEISPDEERSQITVEFELHETMLYWLSYVLLTVGLQLTLVHLKQKIKTHHDCIAYSFLSEGCFCFPIFPCFHKHIEFGQNFVTKKPKQKIETWRLVPMYGNKCLQNFSCQMKR